MSNSVRALRMATWLAQAAMILAALASVATAITSAAAAREVPVLVQARMHALLCLPPGPWSPPFTAIYASSAMTTLEAVAFAAFVVWARQAFLLGKKIARPGRLLAAPREVVAMWLVPLIHLFMPFWYMRGLLSACDPSDLPPIEAERELAAASYRRPGASRVDAWERPSIPFRAWWGLWIASVVVSFELCRTPDAWLAMSDPPAAVLGFELRVAHAFLILATLGAFWIVVRGTTEILMERARRLGA